MRYKTGPEKAESVASTMLVRLYFRSSHLECAGTESEKTTSDVITISADITKAVPIFP